jgi:hypothetical protein
MKPVLMERINPTPSRITQLGGPHTIGCMVLKKDSMYSIETPCFYALKTNCV